MPGLLVPILLTFGRSQPLSDNAALSIGLAGVLVAVLWQGGYQAGLLTSPDGGYPLGLPPMLPGLIVTVALGIYHLKAGPGAVMK